MAADFDHTHVCKGKLLRQKYKVTQLLYKTYILWLELNPLNVT